ncbi:MgtC/SapB family protein [Cupriavidus sp. amp6]|uniref:MgtC/SapB family protein n=1 Tax=Cupriavidus sp. amp6 TaxID=388051 RepID=UPI00350FC7F3
MRWFGGVAEHSTDPTRGVQGVVTGVGFLYAGVIMKDGLSISGLTTAASISAASAVGVLLGVEFYAAALLLAMLCMLSMSLLHRLEVKLPGRATLDVSLTFRVGPPDLDVLARAPEARGYHLLRLKTSALPAGQRSRAKIAVPRTNIPANNPPRNRFSHVCEKI